MKPRGEPWEVRQEFEGRPALFALLGLIVGLTAVSHPFNLLALLTLFWLRSLRGRCWCAGLFILGLALNPPTPKPILSREFITDAGTITSAVRHDGNLQRCQVDVSRGTLSLLLADGPRLKSGDHIQIQGVASPIGPSEERIERQLLTGTLRSGPNDIMIISEGGPIATLADDGRTSFEQATKAMPPEAAAIAQASVFGVDDVSPVVTQRLHAAGAISIASVSGLQILILTGVWLALAGRAPIPRGAALALLAGGLILYATACGLHPGVIRACLMSALLSVAYLVRRDPDLLSALAIAGLIELLWRPAWVYNFGFQISFAIIGTLALWMPKRSRVLRKPPVAQAGWLIGGIAALFLAATPLLAYETGEVRLLSPILGALIVPAVAPMFCLSLAGWGLGLAWPWLGALWMNWLVAPLAGWVLVCSDLGATASAWTVEIPPFNAYLLVPLYALIALGARYTSSAFSGERQ